MLLEAGASVNLISFVSHKWPDNEIFETMEPSIVTATRLGNLFVVKNKVSMTYNLR